MGRIAVKWKALCEAMGSAFEEFYLDTRTGELSTPDPGTGKDGPGPHEVLVVKRPASLDYTWMIQFAGTVADPGARLELMNALADSKNGMERFKERIKSMPELYQGWKRYHEVHCFGYISKWLTGLGIEFEPDPRPPDSAGTGTKNRTGDEMDIAKLDIVLDTLHKAAKPLGFRDLSGILAAESGIEDPDAAIREAMQQGLVTMSGGLKTNGEVMVFTRQGEKRLLDMYLERLDTGLEAAVKDPQSVRAFTDLCMVAGEVFLCRFLDSLEAERVKEAGMVLSEIRSEPGTRTEAAIRRAISRSKEARS